ncbi:unnamed protein product [Chrysoparadoxa australica]
MRYYLKLLAIGILAFALTPVRCQEEPEEEEFDEDEDEEQERSFIEIGNSLIGWPEKDAEGGDSFLKDVVTACGGGSLEEGTELWDCVDEAVTHGYRAAELLVEMHDLAVDALCEDPELEDEAGLILPALKIGESQPTCATTDPDGVELQRTDGFLEKEELDSLLEFINQSEWKKEGGGLSGNIFKKSKGLAVRFTEEGSSQLYTNERTKGLTKIWEKTRSAVPGSNFWLVNMLICYPEAEGTAAAEGDEEEDEEGEAELAPAVKDHFDSFPFESEDWSIFLTSHEVHVLYVSLPEGGIEGGELEIYDDSFKGKVTPEENLKIAFRGDLYHRVNGFHNANNTTEPRISLVIENYKVPEVWLPHAPTFSFAGESPGEVDRYGGGAEEL